MIIKRGRWYTWVKCSDKNCKHTIRIRRKEDTDLQVEEELELKAYASMLGWTNGRCDSHVPARKPKVKEKPVPVTA